MMNGEPIGEQTVDTLREELDLLRDRLHEAEAILDAIRYDKVDALVISDTEGEHVRTIESLGVIANSIFDQVVQPVFVLNVDNHILRGNRAAVDLCGGNIEGRALHEVLPLRAIPEGRSGEPLSDVLPDGWIREREEPLRTEVTYVDQTGTSRYFLMEAKVFFLPREEFTGGIVTLVDITSEKLAEIELAVRNGQLHYQFELTTAITNNAAEALVLLDDQGRVIFMNPAAERLFGCDEDFLLGRMLSERVRLEESGEEPRLSGDPIQLVGITRVERNFQALLSRWDGVHIPVHGSVSPVKAEGGRLTGSVLVLRDVSDLMEAEHALRTSEEKQRQSQKMEAIGLLAGGIAHDFNNLLTAINGYADLLMAAIGAGTPEHDCATEIRRAGERASELTSQLLAFGRKQMQSSRILSLNESVREVSKMLSRVIGENIEIVLDLAEDLGSIRADPVQIEQVLLNLAINARDAMMAGGTLVLETANVEWERDDPHSPLHGTDGGSFVRLSVRDTGTGMDQDTRERVFEPFFTTKDSTGLGLSTVYGIVQQSGGRISVSSEPGVGTEFEIYFPRADVGSDEPATPPDVPDDRPTRGTETILLVEDEDVVRQLIVRILQSLGYSVLAASSGMEALAVEETHEGPIHLLLTDVVMPGMGGRELARRLRPRRPDMAVAHMSGYTDDDVFREPSPSEPLHFIKKPFASAEITRFVRETLDARNPAES